VIHSQKPPRLSLNFHKVFENSFNSSTTDSTEVRVLRHVQVEDKLLKRISIDYEDLPPASPGILQQICEQYEQVVHLRFNINYENNRSFQDVLHVLENNLCPNLRRLEGDFSGFFQDAETIICSFLPITPKLEFIGVTFMLIDDMLDEGHKVNFKLLFSFRKKFINWEFLARLIG
jgi:hypothetical protein